MAKTGASAGRQPPGSRAPARQRGGHASRRRPLRWNEVTRSGIRRSRRVGPLRRRCAIGYWQLFHGRGPHGGSLLRRHLGPLAGIDRPILPAVRAGLHGLVSQRLFDRFAQRVAVDVARHARPWLERIRPARTETGLPLHAEVEVHLTDDLVAAASLVDFVVLGHRIEGIQVHLAIDLSRCRARGQADQRQPGQQAPSQCGQGSSIVHRLLFSGRDYSGGDSARILA